MDTEDYAFENLNSHLEDGGPRVDYVKIADYVFDRLSDDDRKGVEDLIGRYRPWDVAYVALRLELNRADPRLQIDMSYLDELEEEDEDLSDSVEDPEHVGRDSDFDSINASDLEASSGVSYVFPERKLDALDVAARVSSVSNESVGQKSTEYLQPISEWAGGPPRMRLCALPTNVAALEVDSGCLMRSASFGDNTYSLKRHSDQARVWIIVGLKASRLRVLIAKDKELNFHIAPEEEPIP